MKPLYRSSGTLETEVPTRVIRIGHTLWRARLVAPDERPAEALVGREYVEVMGPDDRRHWLVFAVGEFARLSRYRLRCIILGLARSPEPNE
jgi:hypothetical protein